MRLWRKFNQRILWHSALMLAALLVCAHAAEALRPQPTTETAPHHLSVFAPQLSYTVDLVTLGNSDCAGLFDVIEPLRRIDARTTGDRWKISVAGGGGKTVEAVFQDGSRTATINGEALTLSGSFHLSSGRGYLPPQAIAALLPRLVNLPAEYQASSRRLFLGTAPVRFSAALKDSRLRLSFSATVTPVVTASGNTLRLVFNHEMLSSPGWAKTSYTDSVFTGATFTAKDNGSSEVLIRATAPIANTSTDGGRTLTIAATSASASAQTPAAHTISQPAQQNVAGHAVLVVIDPAHGGADNGASLGNGLYEKDASLQLARLVAQQLQQKGITCVLTRNADTAVSTAQRVAPLGAAPARQKIFITIHATASGRGVHIYTSLLSPAPGENKKLFQPWGKAQAAYVNQSRVLAATLAKEFTGRGMTAKGGLASLEPLDNLTATAVAVEISPLSGTSEEIVSASYQQNAASAIVAAIAANISQNGGTR